MEIKIIQVNKSLRAFKDNSLLFYSTAKINIFNRIIKVFNCDDILVLELKITDLIFKTSYKILFQNNNLINHIEEISYKEILFDNGESFVKRFNHRIISYYHNYYYIYKNTKIVQVNHNTKNYRCKMIVDIDDQNSCFLNQILVHILSMRIADPNDN